MNKFFTLLALVFLLNKTTVAQQKNFTFKSLGHEETIIYGLSGSSSFYFKISPLVDVKGSKIVLIFGILIFLGLRYLMRRGIGLHSH